MRIRSLLAVALLVALLGLSLSACGGDDDDGGTSPTSTKGTPGAETPGDSETPGSSDGGGAGGVTATVTVADGTAAVGQTAQVGIQALGLGAPGLGAYTVDISYDAAIATATACDGPEDQGLSFCNPDYDPGIVRTVGAIAEGVEGDVGLGTITFTCQAAGTTELTISVDTLADATIGQPTAIDHTEEHGTLTCS